MKTCEEYREIALSQLSEEELNGGDAVSYTHLFPGDDMAVLVAGLSERIGEHAAALRAAGVPVMVATTLPRLVESIAEAAGAPIPHGDVVAPEAPHGRLLGCGRDAQAVAVGAEADAAGDAAEPALLDQRAAALLDRRMGEWISCLLYTSRCV